MTFQHGDDDERVDQPATAARGAGAAAPARGRGGARRRLRALIGGALTAGSTAARRVERDQRAGRSPASPGRRSRPPGAACAGRTTSTYSRSGSAARASSALSSRNSQRRRVGDARAHAQHLVAQLRRIQRDVARHLRPRADQAHVAAQHVDQLRQLVELGAAQERAGARDARIGADGERRPALTRRRRASCGTCGCETARRRGRPAPGGRTPGPANRAGSTAPRRAAAAPAAPARQRPRARSNSALGHGRRDAALTPARPARAATTRCDVGIGHARVDRQAHHALVGALRCAGTTPAARP